MILVRTIFLDSELSLVTCCLSFLLIWYFLSPKHDQTTIRLNVADLLTIFFLSMQNGQNF